MECGQEVLRERIGRRVAAEEPDHRHRRLLRACRERPSHRTAEQGDEIATPHGAYPKARDHGLKYSRSRWLSGVHRNKKRRLMSALGHKLTRRHHATM